MQILHTGRERLRIGDRVVVRRERWRITGFESHDECGVVTLAGVGPANAGVERRVLTPFERIERIARSTRLRLVSARRWRRECRAMLASTGTPASLWSAATAKIDLLPHQLEPALAVTTGLGTRVLIADAVGLGKTIQTALIISELIGRGAASRALVLTPAGLRDQWLTELSTRFALEFSVVDAAAIRRRRRDLPAGANPWVALPLAVSSLDYVKRHDVLTAVQDCSWDIVVVDEAHGAVSDSERHRAVAALARGAPYVILLTATPHSGDEQAFRSLLELGERHDRPLVFRRTRADVALPVDRRIHQLHVRPSADERSLYERLHRFVEAVEREHGQQPAILALSVLRKRALSSAHAVGLSVRRRLLALAPEPAAVLWQMPLPLGADGETGDGDEVPLWTVPGLSDRGLERRLLVDIVGAAERAASRESKLRALSRLLRRLRQPAIVFTEYRDTLLHVRDAVLPAAAILHGGMTRDERHLSLARFAAGAILLATDAAGEGLNLHEGCRIVINLELPWNPARLEQRIGRVDRIGQRRRVHVFHLIARGTEETRILARLDERVVRAQAAIGAANPLSNLVCDPTAPTSTATTLTRLEERAAAEQTRLRRARSFGPRDVWFDAVFLARPGAAWRRRLGGKALLVATTVLRSEHGRSLGLFMACALTPPLNLPVSQFVGLRQLAAHLQATERIAWLDEAQRVHEAFWIARLTREKAIGSDVAPASSAQPGLFDRRVEREWERETVRDRERDAARAQRLAQLRQLAALEEEPAIYMLVLTT